MFNWKKYCAVMLAGALSFSTWANTEEVFLVEQEDSVSFLEETGTISEELLEPVVMETMDWWSERGTVHGVYLASDYPLVGVAWSLYHVYGMQEIGHYTPLVEYYSLGEIQDVDSQTEWTVYQQTIDNYINAYQFSPMVTGVTDSQGGFTISDLEAGLYLLKFEAHFEDDHRFVSQGSLLAVPGSGNGLTADWEQTVYPKVTFSTFDDSEEFLVDLQVNKVWRGDEGLEIRPEDLEITLFENGAIFDEVILNEGNSWSYRWTDLSGDSTWAVLEKVPTGYIATYLQDGRLFTIRNTYVNSTELGGGDGFGVGGGIAVENDTTYFTDVEGALTQTGGSLTQTGALTWPLPYLTAGGMALILFGILLRKSGDY